MRKKIVVSNGMQREEMKKEKGRVGVLRQRERKKRCHILLVCG